MATAAKIIQRRRKRRTRRRAARTRQRVGLGIVFGLLAVLFVLPSVTVAGTTAFVYWNAVRDLPTPQESVMFGPAIGPTRLYDSSGHTLLFSVEDMAGEGPPWLTLDALPPYVVQATLQMEDPDFLTDREADLLETANKLWRNFISGPLPPEPSLTGRLVRNTLMAQPQFPTADERAREYALVAEIDRLYSPAEILEWHLNTNYYGNDAYGIEAAAQVYFGRHAADLTLDEAAMLAAIPLAPQYNPFDDGQAAQGRQDELLRLLRVNDHITAGQFEEATTTLTAVQLTTGQRPRIAPEFALYARKQAEDLLDSLGYDGARLVARGGLKITTTLDLDLYFQSECFLRAHLARLNRAGFNQQALDGSPCRADAYLPPSGALPGNALPDDGVLAVIDVETGALLSAVGDVTNIAHQPGPTLFPFVYFEGFRSALYTPATMVLDIPLRFPGPVDGLIYTPTNRDNVFRGPMNLRDAMSAGLLPATAQVANRVGLDNVLRRAHFIGLNSLEEGTHDLSLLERGGAVSVLDVTYAYSVFASLGEMRGVSVVDARPGFRGRNPVAVLRIEDAAGDVLWEYNDEIRRINRTDVFPEPLGYLINDVLASASTRREVFGGSNPLEMARPAAVVNGVTGNEQDSWTVGYTPHVVTGVWLGSSDGGLTLDSFGLQGAAPVWRAIMDYVHARDSLPVQRWERPPEIVEFTVCERSGLAPHEDCPPRREIFYQNTQPTQVDNYWQVYEVNGETGRLATANTPAALRTERIFFVPPPEAVDWWRANRFPLPPTEFDTVSRPELLASATIEAPSPFAYINGIIDIRGSLDTGDLKFYQLAYGEGVNPASWVQIGGQQSVVPVDGVLGSWDTRGLNGLYNLRLSVVRNDDTIETAIIQVSVDNAPPQITLRAGTEGKIYRWPNDRSVMLEAEVTDNLAIDRVEFYHNGELVGTDETWPYGFDWNIRAPGSEQFSAVAFDNVGNRAAAEITVEIERSGS